MGWIYNGSEFIKANKAQRAAFDKYQNQKALAAALSAPLTIPTVALTAAAVITGGLVVAKISLFLKSLSTPAEILKQEVDTLIDETVETIEQTIKPARDFAADIKQCFDGALFPGPFGKIWLPTLSEPRFVFCMSAKGYTGATIAEALKSL